jgi:predicted nucleotidyltransferase
VLKKFGINMGKSFYPIVIVLSFFIPIESALSVSHLNNERVIPQILGLGPLANKSSVINDPLLPEIIHHIRTKYGVDAVILYGSRARGTPSAKSDYNIIGLKKSGEKKTYQEFFKGTWINISVRSPILKVDEVHPMFWQEAVILYQEQHKGEQFVNAAKRAFYNNQKAPLITKECAIRSLIKQFSRSQKDEVEEHYYRRTFLVMALENYFYIHHPTYSDMGSRKSLEWIEKYDPLTYAAFKKALTPNALTKDLYALLEQIVGPNLDMESQVQRDISHMPPTKEKYRLSEDRLLPEITKHMQEKYKAHTVILYGSRAKGTATPKSDYDILAFRKTGTPRESVVDLWKGIPLDLHLVPESAMDELEPWSAGVVEGAVILCQKDNFGERFIENKRKRYAQGFFTSDQIKNNIIDAIKLTLWKVDNTDTGQYYRNQLLSSFPDYYSTLHNLYYLGPRSSLKWLKKNDPLTFNAFSKALKPDATIESLKELIEHVTAPFIQ